MSILTIDQFNKLVRPVERPTRSFHCGFNYLEKWLDGEMENARHGVDLNPDFQRGHVWTEYQQQYFIENTLRKLVGEDGLTIRLNCPTWRNDQASDSDLLDQVVCIDGLQRLTAIRKFIAGDMEPFGINYTELPRRILLRDNTVVLKMYDFQYRRDLLQFYLDINGGGTVHTESELSRVREMLGGAA